MIALEFNNIPPYTYTSEINFWEFSGSLRYNIFLSDLRPYLLLGYSWLWYRLENAQANGELFGQVDPSTSFANGSFIHIGPTVQVVDPNPWS